MSQLHDDLLAVKENLLTYGWHQGSYAERLFATGADSNEGRRCTAGGINHAIGGVSCYAVRLGHLDRVIAVEKLLEELLDGSSIPRWNDTPGRTFEQVIDLLDRALAVTAEPVIEHEQEAVMA